MSSHAVSSNNRSNPIIDILIVAAASYLAFFLEGQANTRGLIVVSEQAKGVSGVIAGALSVVVLVRLRGGSWSDLGFRKPARWATVPFWVAGILLAFIAGELLGPVLISQFMTLPEPDYSKYDAIAGNLPAALTMALLLPLTASIPEEIIYRGFLIGRLEAIFGGSAVPAVVVQSVIFGSIHFQWGIGGMFMTLIMGLVWGTSYILCGRNLWIVILAHSGGHILLVTQLYYATPITP